MDYWLYIELVVHFLFDEVRVLFLDSLCWFFSVRVERIFWDVFFEGNELFVFGSEIKGLFADIIQVNEDWFLIISYNDNIRSLNLAIVVGVVIYEVFRQTWEFGC